jgi:CRP-like cAMP-binding protein
VTPDTVIIRQGDVGKGLYVILSGEVCVTADGGHGSIEVARLGGAEVFGEVSLIRHATTTATVTATHNSTLLFLPRPLFERLVAGVESLRHYFENLAEDRWIDTSLALSGGLEVDVLI